MKLEQLHPMISIKMTDGDKAEGNEENSLSQTQAANQSYFLYSHNEKLNKRICRSIIEVTWDSITGWTYAYLNSSV